jgi:hypothetical protein
MSYKFNPFTGKFDEAVDVTSFVRTSGDQTVTGVKTFSSSPIVPTPTTDMQTATKKYVDDNAGGSQPISIGGWYDSLLNAGQAVTPLTINAPITASGETVVYTVPAGKCAYFLPVQYFNNSGGAITNSLKVVTPINGYPVIAAASTANNTIRNINTNFVIYEGCQVVFTASAINAGEVRVFGYEFENTGSLKTYFFENFTTASYSPPVGKKAFFLQHRTTSTLSGTPNAGTVLRLSGSNSATTFRLNYSTGATRASSFTVATSSVMSVSNGIPQGVALTEDDEFEITSANTGVFVSFTVYEF